MSRSPRFLPKNQDGVLVEVSCRTVNAWALLRPSAELRDVTVGVEGSYLPAMIFAGDPAPPTPPPPPTREVTKSESGIVERGEIPVVVEIPGRMQAAALPKPQGQDEPRAHGQPP